MLKSHTKPKILQHLVVPKDELPLMGQWCWVWQGGQAQSPQQGGYLLFGSFHFYDFGCQVEPRRYFRALVDLPKTPPVDAKEKMGKQLSRAQHRDLSWNYSYHEQK